MKRLDLELAPIRNLETERNTCHTRAANSSVGSDLKMISSMTGRRRNGSWDNGNVTLKVNVLIIFISFSVFSFALSWIAEFDKAFSRILRENTESSFFSPGIALTSEISTKF